MYNNDFALFLDDTRAARNVSREDFVKDIISQRQYYRFINGESTLKSDVILRLLERLELDNAFFYGFFRKQNDDQFQQLEKIYDYIYENDIKQANELFSMMDKESINSDSNKKFYTFLKEYLSNVQNKRKYEDSSQDLLKLVNYPNILENSVLTFVEKSILIYVTNYLMKQKDYRVASFFYSISTKENKDQNVIDSHSVPFRTTTAKCLGYIGEHEKAYQILKQAEDEFMLHDNYFPLMSMYYFKAKEERNLFDDSRYKDSLRKVFLLLKLSDKETYRERYSSFIAKTFNLKESDLIEYK